MNIFGPYDDMFLVDILYSKDHSIVENNPPFPEPSKTFFHNIIDHMTSGTDSFIYYNKNRRLLLLNPSNSTFQPYIMGMSFNNNYHSISTRLKSLHSNEKVTINDTPSGSDDDFAYRCLVSHICVSYRDTHYSRVYDDIRRLESELNSLRNQQYQLVKHFTEYSFDAKWKEYMKEFKQVHESKYKEALEKVEDLNQQLHQSLMILGKILLNEEEKQYCN